MNAVEIEAAVSDLAAQAFDAVEFPYAFLAAFGNKDTTIKRLRTGNNNSSDLAAGVLQRNNIHLAVCAPEQVGAALKTLRDSPATLKGKAKFILATDGQTLEAEELVSGETIACDYADFANHFGFFLPLAGISTIKEIRDNPIDVRATGRLNKLYVELLRENPDWASEERRSDMNHFMARLIFCFFAEDTDIFNGEGLFTQTVEQMSDPHASSNSNNTDAVISEIFRAMNIHSSQRAQAEPRLPNWANGFPYVNGGLFAGSVAVPRFTRMARTYLLHAGNLNWREINPDIFGSMIQAVADDAERGALGMHYTSVPNILKVLNPLFLDDLREQLAAAGDNKAKLLNLRKRLARIRVFDPACGSGNFLVIAYKQMREIEAQINRVREETSRKSEIPLTNFRGIELRDFPAEIARLALIIAEYQCDVLYRGQMDALEDFLPLDAENWIVCGNALRLDWLSICPPTGTGVKLVADDLFGSPLDQSEIDFANEGGETYICGNPPYKGTKNQSKAEKEDLSLIFSSYTKRSGTLDYVAGWFLKASEYVKNNNADYAFVATNSICQGGQVPVLWPIIYELGSEIKFAYQSFKWRNLATNNAVVTVIIVGVSNRPTNIKKIFQVISNDEKVEIHVSQIGPYLIPSSKVIVYGHTESISGLSAMQLGNAPYDGGNLILEKYEDDYMELGYEGQQEWLRDLWGSTEIINGISRKCIWISDERLESALNNRVINKRVSKVKEMRLSSTDAGTRSMAQRPHQFREMNVGDINALGIPIRSSEFRGYLPVDLLKPNCCITNLAYAIYNSPLMNLSIIASRLHLVWISSVCGRMKTDFSYSNKMGWNTFPVPKLTEQDKADLTRCAENILLAREVHFPATIADLYDPDHMPDNLRRAHEQNDETLERIYIGRRFKNDTERLEKLFDLYVKMTANTTTSKPKAATKRVKN